MTNAFNILKTAVLTIRANGRGQYRRTSVDRHGFPRGYLPRQKMVQGFRTGDLVQAVGPKGKYAGTHQGAVAVRRSGYLCHAPSLLLPYFPPQQLAHLGLGQHISEFYVPWDFVRSETFPTPAHQIR